MFKAGVGRGVEEGFPSRGLYEAKVGDVSPHVTLVPCVVHYPTSFAPGGAIFGGGGHVLR